VERAIEEHLGEARDVGWGIDILAERARNKAASQTDKKENKM